jgi:hypothetical protein
MNSTKTVKSRGKNILAAKRIGLIQKAAKNSTADSRLRKF